jgi:hypothetical protein
MGFRKVPSPWSPHLPVWQSAASKEVVAKTRKSELPRRKPERESLGEARNVFTTTRFPLKKGFIARNI